MLKRISKKGFSIVELIVVMSIILVITATSVVSYTRMTTNYKDKEYERLISEFEAAAETYVALDRSMREIIYSGSGYATITLKVLREAGLVDDDASDPVTGEKFDDRYYVSVYLDDTFNLHAVFMRETASSFTNSRAKQSVLAGSIYTRVQMLEYIIGYTRGEYDPTNSSYGTKEIDYARVIIKVTDITDPDNQKVVSNTKIDTTEVGKKYRIDYSYDFGDDGVKTLVRQVEIYDVAPVIVSVRLQPDALSSYTKDDVRAFVEAQTVHETLEYHYVLNGNDMKTHEASYLVTENGMLNIYVETPYGTKSDTYTANITYIDRKAPTRTVTVRERESYGAYIEVSELIDTDSGLPSSPVYFSGTGEWSSLNVFEVTRNGMYHLKFRDNIGNEETESITISNILLEDFVGKTKAEIQTACAKYDITCNFAGSTSAYAVATYQSITSGTAVADGMIVNLTMEKPTNSVALVLKNCTLKNSLSNIVFNSSSETKTVEIVPTEGYELKSSSVSCSGTASASLSSNMLSITGVSGNATCTITASKKSIDYGN